MKLITDSDEEFAVSKLCLREDDILVLEGLGIKNKVMILFEGMSLSILRKGE
jgi:hypothetical protein